MGHGTCIKSEKDMTPEIKRIAALEAEVRALKLMVKNLYTVAPEYLTTKYYEEDLEEELRAMEEGPVLEKEYGSFLEDMKNILSKGLEKNKDNE